MIGQAIAHYKVTEKIGEGGMGEVYRAHDTKLNRDVALKILPQIFAQDSQRMARFEREAQVLASLNHAHIAQIHGLEETEGTKCLVLELVEGETLAEQISRGPIPVDEALKIALQICEGLEAAHDKGIIHRDLKPANIKITPEGEVKILDFGLAKALEGETPVSDLSHSPTITHAATEAGVILGTASYMSPEQARGKPVDKRTDIWAFGCVLFEMLTGRKAFGGDSTDETVSDVLAAVLKNELDLSALPANTPQVILRLQRRCLAKDLKQRIQDIGDARIELAEAGEDDPHVETVEAGWSTTPSWLRVLALACLPLAILAVLVALYLKLDSGTAAPLIRTSIALPEEERLASGSTFRQSVAVSPDGKWLAWAVFKPVSEIVPSEFPAEMEPEIILRRLDQTVVRRIPGANPFFSPDSRHLGFIERNGQGRFFLKRTSLESRSTEPVTEFPEQTKEYGFGCAWLPNGEIVFSPLENAGLLSVAAVGGEPRIFTELVASEGEYGHRLPSVLPDGKTLLFTKVYHSHLDCSKASIWAIRQDTGDQKKLVEGATDGRYSESGHLLFARDGKLLGVSFDSGRLEIQGKPVPLIDDLIHSVNTAWSGTDTGVAQYSLSRKGMLVYASGSVFPQIGLEISQVGQGGQESPLNVDPRYYCIVRLSPDSRQILLTDLYPPYGVWLYDIEREISRRQVYEGRTAHAIWGPGPYEFTFDSSREGGTIYIKTLEAGPDEADRLFPEMGVAMPSSWSPDGRWLAFVRSTEDTRHDIWLFDRDKGATTQFPNTRFEEKYPEFSPNGRWLAYTSDESGRDEVYVRSFPELRNTVQISTAGGVEPCWSRDGQEIFFSRTEEKRQQAYYVVRVKPDGEKLRPAPPTRIVEGNYEWADPVRGYDVGFDGKLLLLKRDPRLKEKILSTMAPARIEIVQSWFEELRRLVPTE